MSKHEELTALELSYDLWKWLYLNPGKIKQDYPKYLEEIKDLNCDCPLCEYYNTCLRCPVWLIRIIAKDVTNDNFTTLLCFGRAVQYYFDTDNTRKSATAYIASKIRRRLRKVKRELKDVQV